ncbi:2-oxoacid:acceptor oxidoreductase family protein [Desulfuromonas thiophila]|uniref:2-oxoacid:acceptor oxidoreductase family protein n=1 Tax=Desulfuromonas thiophila TaxID=57664 RepID=UPI0024A7A9C8|nr:2-oxoacid:acceptor oxidoreductase family protein [Desulfuromonas thiophila]
MKQQIIVSGIGGQGVLLLTRVIAQAALSAGLPVLTSETHGMAQRGGSVLSTIKVGGFASPLIRAGQADVALLLWADNLAVHRPLLKADGALFINSASAPAGCSCDASALARQIGPAVLANLVLLGCALRQQALFCDAAACRAAIEQLVPARLLAVNLQALDAGLAG